MIDTPLLSDMSIARVATNTTHVQSEFPVSITNTYNYVRLTEQETRIVQGGQLRVLTRVNVTAAGGN